MARTKKETVKVTRDGQEIVLDVKLPSPHILTDAQILRAAEWQKAVNKGAILRERLEDIMREQKLWDDDKEQKFRSLRKAIFEGEHKIMSGGIPLEKDTEKKKSARTIALEMIAKRNELRELLAQRNRLDGNTAEALADNAQFNYIVSECVYDGKTGKRYFENREDYESRAGDEESLAAATKLFSLMNNLDEDAENKLPEIKFLQKWHYMDAKRNLLNKQGQRVDSEGRLIDEEGNFINEQGEKVDELGYVIDKDGNYKVEFVPFEDEEGNPVADPDIDNSSAKVGDEGANGVDNSNSSDKSEPSKVVV